jgi:hypothetical protein
VERIDYINAVKKGRYVEEHGIWVPRNCNISRIKKAAKY